MAIFLARPGALPRVRVRRGAGAPEILESGPENGRPPSRGRRAAPAQTVRFFGAGNRGPRCRIVQTWWNPDAPACPTLGCTPTWQTGLFSFDLS